MTSKSRSAADGKGEKPRESGFSLDDLLRKERIKALVRGPGADAVTVAVSTIESEADAYRSRLWQLPLDGSEPRPLSVGTSIDNQPQWAPDGHALAFLSDREGGAPQLFTLPAAGGEAALLRAFEHGVVSFEWRPDGKALLVTAPVAIDPADCGARTRGTQAGGAGGPEVVWRPAGLPTAAGSPSRATWRRETRRCARGWPIYTRARARRPASWRWARTSSRSSAPASPGTRIRRA